MPPNSNIAAHRDSGPPAPPNSPGTVPPLRTALECVRGLPVGSRAVGSRAVGSSACNNRLPAGTYAIIGHRLHIPIIVPQCVQVTPWPYSCSPCGEPLLQL